MTNIKLTGLRVYGSCIVLWLAIIYRGMHFYQFDGNAWLMSLSAKICFPLACLLTIPIILFDATGRPWYGKIGSWLLWFVFYLVFFYISPIIGGAYYSHHFGAEISKNYQYVDSHGTTCSSEFYDDAGMRLLDVSGNYYQVCIDRAFSQTLQAGDHVKLIFKSSVAGDLLEDFEKITQ